MASLPYDDRLEHLLATAARVFAAKGYHPTTMRDLARETGMSLAGMYHYVDGKDELLSMIQERCFLRVLDGARVAVESGTTPIDRLERFIRHHVTFFARHMSEMKVLSHEAESLSTPHVTAIKALKRKYVDLLLDLLAALESGGDRGAEMHVSAYALFGMMNWIYTWYDPDGPLSPEQLADRLSQLYLSGILNASISLHATKGDS